MSDRLDHELRAEATAAMMQAYQSLATFIPLAALTALAATLTIAHATGPNPNRAVVGLSALVTLGAGAVATGAYKLARSDADYADTVTHPAFRADARRALVDVQIDHRRNGSPATVAMLERAWNAPVAPEVFPEERRSGQPPRESSTSPLIESLGTSPRSTIIVGQPGAGKGRLVKHALGAVKRHHPDTAIWVIDPKQDDTESHQWDVCDRISTVPLPAFPTPPEVARFKTETTAIIEAFKELPGPKLLVLDEAMAVKEVTGAWFKTLMAGFNSLCSMGRSRQHWGWVISQSPNTTDLGLTGGARNVYTRVMVVHADDLGLLANNSTFTNGRPTPEHLGGDSRRAIYLSTRDTWASLPVLT